MAKELPIQPNPRPPHSLPSAFGIFSARREPSFGVIRGGIPRTIADLSRPEMSPTNNYQQHPCQPAENEKNDSPGPKQSRPIPPLLDIWARRLNRRPMAFAVCWWNYR
jgi:hypothetical protein